jgi:hypothetical protein
MLRPRNNQATPDCFVSDLLQQIKRMCFQYVGYVTYGNLRCVCVHRRNRMARVKQDQHIANVNTQMFMFYDCNMNVTV